MDAIKTGTIKYEKRTVGFVQVPYNKAFVNEIKTLGRDAFWTGSRWEYEIKHDEFVKSLIAKHYPVVTEIKSTTRNEWATDGESAWAFNPTNPDNN